MNKYTLLQKEANELNILFTEDDHKLREETKKILKKFFNEVVLASNGKEGLDMYLNFYKENNKYFDIVITDIKMPIKNGIELSKNILKINKNQELIIISAYENSKYLIELINLGINNFVKKPLVIDQLVNPLLSICKKINKLKKAMKIIYFADNFSWCKEQKVLKHFDKEVRLSSSETILLNLLIYNPYIIFSNEDIYNTIYSENFHKEASVDSIKSLIKRIRKKIPNNLINNIYGKGYRINKDLFIDQ